jgi:DNA-binding MarR family transcriptional regulator
MTYRTGSLREFMTWTKQVIRDPGAASGKPKRRFDSAATARSATARAALGRPAPGREVSPEAMVKLLSPVNLRLLEILARKQPRSVQELADLAGRKPASVSRTLKRLTAAGIVAMSRGAGRTRRPALFASRVQLEIDLTAKKRRAIAIRARAAA